MHRSTPGLPVNHHLPEFTQTHVHRVGDAIQPSHPLSSPSPPAPNPSQHQSLFQWMLLPLLLLSHFSRVRLLVTPWTAAYQASLSMGFSRQEYWSGLPLPSPYIYIIEYIYILFFTLFHYAAAKSLQSYSTLCDPIDSSPSGSAVPGILQAKTLE